MPMPYKQQYSHKALSSDYETFAMRGDADTIYNYKFIKYYNYGILISIIS